MDKAIILKL